MFNEPIDVYWNLHKKVFSVKSRATGRVIMHADGLTLPSSVELIVQPAGLSRAREEKCKNVHAFLRAPQFTLETPEPDQNRRQLTYNPYKEGCWVYADTREPAGTQAAVVCSIKDGKPVVQILEKS
jgi:hypothetical protein